MSDEPAVAVSSDILRVRADIPPRLRAAVAARLGLPAERVHLAGEDPAGALRSLTTQIKEML